MANSESQIRDVQDGFGTFVFGSNLAGRHGKGAALLARTYRGARTGKGYGPQGTCYALPTKDVDLKILSLKEISKHVSDFLAYAQSRPNEVFQLTRVGCGLTGYRDSEIAPMFYSAPKNIILPGIWRQMREIDFVSVSIIADEYSTEEQIQERIEHLIETKGNPIFSVIAGTVAERAIIDLADRKPGLRIQCFSPNPGLYKDSAKACLEMAMVWAASEIQLIGPEQGSLLQRIQSIAQENGVSVVSNSGNVKNETKAQADDRHEEFRIQGKKKPLSLIYAGIGSRKTPLDILRKMESLAENFARRGFLLRSGAAEGADTAFERGCDEAKGPKEIWLPWNGFEGRAKSKLLPTADMMKIAARIHPVWSNLSQGEQKLHARNVGQVLGANCDVPADFVVCWTKDGCEQVSPAYAKTGGTRTAIALANEYKVPVFNLRNDLALQRLYEYLNRIEVERTSGVLASPTKSSQSSSSAPKSIDSHEQPKSSAQQQLSF